MPKPQICNSISSVGPTFTEIQLPHRTSTSKCCQTRNGVAPPHRPNRNQSVSPTMSCRRKVVCHQPQVHESPARPPKLATVALTRTRRFLVTYRREASINHLVVIDLQPRRRLHSRCTISTSSPPWATAPAATIPLHRLRHSRDREMCAVLLEVPGTDGHEGTPMRVLPLLNVFRFREFPAYVGCYCFADTCCVGWLSVRVEPRSTLNIAVDLERKLVDAVPHVVGLNPKAFRQFV
ncbi:hypothetical protein E2542_SST06788 [Spatholobus suberectus]|nr:hypothetical protein E2542_SST06788 [Spatholobus suberectus]